MDTTRRAWLIERLAIKIEMQQCERLKKDRLDCEVNLINSKVNIKHGKLYTKINFNLSGKYMIDLEGNIFGIKAHGVVNKKRSYGNLETFDKYYWGDYTAAILVT